MRYEKAAQTGDVDAMKSLQKLTVENIRLAAQQYSVAHLADPPEPLSSHWPRALSRN